MFDASVTPALIDAQLTLFSITAHTVNVAASFLLTRGWEDTQSKKRSL
jgi:hypothetical protein